MKTHKASAKANVKVDVEVESPARLRVVSFNIRNCTAPDGDDHWDHRRDLVARTLLDHNADLVGLQEGRFSQVAYLRERLSDHAFVGIGRDDGRDDHEAAGEFAAIFFRRSRFEKLEEGHFWLSETPHVVGSKGWDAPLPRMASWARLCDGQTSRTLRFLNTHLEWEGVRARQASASLLRAHLDSLDAIEPAILTGDFNDAEGSVTYGNMFSEVLDPDGSAALPPVDVFRAVFPQAQDDEGTYHGFTGTSHKKRIDWIVARGPITPVSAAIDRRHFDGRYPSDHFPVVADVLTKPA